MWQIICLCLPAVTRSEQQRFFSLLSEALHTHGREAGEMDLGLFFLHALSPQESLTVLEERLDLVIRSQEIVEGTPDAGDIIASIIHDHLRTLLAAERDWLHRTIAHLQSVEASHDRSVSTELHSSAHN